MFGNLASTFQAFVEFRAIDELSKPLREIKSLTDKTRSSLEKLTEASAKLAEQGAKLTAFFGGLTAPFGVAIHQAIEFEKVFIGEFNKVVGASGKQLEDFKNYFVELSNQIPLTATEIAQLAAGLAQMGIPTDQLKEFTKLVAQAAFAFDITAEEAGKAFGEIRNAFGIKTIEDLRKVGDTINYLSNTMGASAADLVEILKRIGAAAKLLGLDAKSVAVFAATIREAGYAPELVSSALSVLFQRLATFDSNLKQVITSLGWTTQEFQRLVKSHPEQAILKLLTALKGLDSTKRAQLLKELVGTEHFAKIAVLLNNLDKVKTKLSEIHKGAYKGSMAQEVQGLMQTTAAQMELLRNRLQNIAIAIGSILLPPFNALVRAISAVLTPIATFINEHQTLGRIILFPVVGIGALIALIGVLAGTFGLAGIAVAKGIGTILELRKTLTDLKGTVLEVLPTLKGLALQVWANVRAFAIWVATGNAQTGWLRRLDYGLRLFKLRLMELYTTLRTQGVKAFLVGQLTAIQSALVSFATVLQTRFSGAKGVLASIPIYIRNIGTSLLAAGRASLAFIATPLGATLTAIGIAAYLVWKNFDKIKAVFVGLYRAVVESRLKPFFEGIKIGLIHIKEGLNTLKGAFSPLVSAFRELKTALAELFKPFKTLFAELYNAVKPVINAVAKLFGFDSSAFTSSLEKGITLGKALAFVFNTTAKVIALALKPIVWILTLIVKAITKVIEGLKKLFEWAKKAFEAVKKPLEIGKHIVGGIAEGVKNTAKRAVDAVKGVGHKIVEGFKSLFGIKSPSRLFMGFGINLLEGLFLGIRKLENKPLEVLRNLVQTTQKVLGNFFAPKVAVEHNLTETRKVFYRNIFHSEEKPVKRETAKSVLINKLIDRLEVVIQGGVKGEPSSLAKEFATELESTLEAILLRF